MTSETESMRVHALTPEGEPLCRRPERGAWLWTRNRSQVTCARCAALLAGAPERCQRDERAAGAHGDDEEP